MASPRRIYFLNKKFQLRFAFYVCSWLIALSFTYPLIISNLFDYLISYLALDPLGPTLANLEKTREDLLWLLVSMQVILISFTFFISIFMSHKIAGPLYKLSKLLREAAAGNLEQRLVFRKSDYFQELAPDYNTLMESIQKRIAQRSNGIQTAIPYLKKALSSSNLETQRELETALNLLRNADQS